MKLELAFLAGCSLAFSLLVGCSGDDSASANNEDLNNPFIVKTDTLVNEHGDTVIVQDTMRQKIDTIMHITEKGETTYVTEKIYVGLDTTLHWVGNSALLITEIMPLNLDWTDEDGDDGSWVEIYNAGSEDANLKGYSLIENLKATRKWVFGNEIIKAKSFRIVFCDKKNRPEAAGANDTKLTNGDGEYTAHYRTHTNWKMEKDGSTIYLIDPYYGIRDSVAYPAMESGVSWGIVDGGSWKFFDKPTPEKVNTEATAYDDMAPTVNMDAIKSGFYNDQLTLNPPTGLGEGVKVRCTRDGSVPTSSSQEFNSPITFESTTPFRCSAYKDGTITKEVISRTFFIGESVSMPVVAISVDPEFFEKHYVPKSKCGSSDPKSCPAGLLEEVEYPVHVEYFADGSNSKGPTWEIEAGISLMGGWSRVNDKKSVAITMREGFQDGRLKYPLFTTRKSDSVFKAFNLRNNGNRFVSDYVEDAMAGALLEGSGVDYQRSRQVVVFYNGKYYGIHDMCERYNRAYVETNYHIDANQVEMVKHLGSDTAVSASGGGSIDNYVNMLHFVGDNDMTAAENYAKAKTLLDVGNFADYMAAEIYYHNGDWPNNNVRAWRSPEHPWKFMVYDVDHGFGWEWGVDDPNGGKFGDGTNMFTWIKQGGGNKPCKASGCFANLYIKLIQNEDFKRMFINRSCVMWKNYLNSERVAKIVDQMVSTIPESEKVRDVEKFHQDELYYPSGFDWKGSHLKSWASERDGKVLSEYKKEFFDGNAELVSVTIGTQGSGAVLMDGMNLPGSTYTGEFFSGNKMELTAVPSSGSVFESWSDGSTENPHIVTISGGLTITAKFK